jgi:PAS domain S-box-containing protein
MKALKNSLTDLSILRQKAEALVKSKSSININSKYADIEIYKLYHELEVHKLELEMQNEELLLALQNVQDAVELYDFSPIAYFSLSHIGEIITINQKGLKIIGRERSKLIGSRFGFFVSDETKPIFNHFLDEIFKNKNEESCEICLFTHNNIQLCVYLSGTLNRNGDKCLMTLTDITQTKQLNQKLLESEMRLNKTQKIAHIGSWELDVISEQLILSDEVYHIFGLNPQEFSDTYEAFLNLVHPEDRDLVKAAYFSSLKENKNGYEIEHRIVRKHTGEIRHVYEKCQYIKDTSGKIIGWLGMVLDITESKHADEELQKIKEQFSLAMDAANDGLWDWDVKSGVVYYSPGYFRILGYQPNEFESSIEIWQELLHPDDRQKALAYNDACVNNTIESINLEFRMKAKDGSWRWILSRGKAVKRDENGKAMRLIGTHMDITQSKHSELALIESESKYRELVENLPDAIVIFVEGKIVYVNKQCVQLFAAETKEELYGKLIIEFVHPDYHVTVIENREKLAKEGGVLPMIVEKLINQDGKVIDIEVKASSARYENKSAIQLIIRDISERIAAEQTIKLANIKIIESEKRFSLFMDYLPATVFIKDVENRLVYANKNMDITLGASKWLGLTSYEIFDEQTAERILADDNSTFEMGYKKTEESYLHLDGSMHHYVTQKFLISDDGRTELLGGIATDITERKMYEIQIRDSRDRYWNLIELAVDGILIGTNDGIIIDANSCICSMLGLYKSEVIGKNITDSIFTNRSIKKSPFQFDKLRNGEVVISERNILRPDSTEITVEMRTKMMPNGTYQSIYRDITQRVRMEEELKYLNENLENLVGERTAELLTSNFNINKIKENYEQFFNTIDDLLFVIDEKGKIKHVNSNVLVRLGYKIDELIEKSVIIIYPKEYLKEALQTITAMIAGETDSCTLPIRKKSGDYIYAESKIKPGIWNSQNVFFVLSRDISKIKLSEEKFAKVFYLNPSACGLTDLLTGVYLDVNDAFTKLFGYAKEEVIGKTAIELGIMSSEIRAGISQKIDKYGKLHNLETELKTKYGNIKNVILSADNISLYDGTIRFTVVQDITDIKQSEIYSKQQLYYTIALNKIAELIIINEDAKEILENANRIIGQTLKLDRILIYKISFDKNLANDMCEWINQDFPEIESVLGKYNALEMYLNALKSIENTHNYLVSYYDEINECFTKDESANILHKYLDIKSLLWFPFAFYENGYYMFTLNQISEKRLWTQDEINFLISVSKQISLALIKIQFLEERKASEAELFANKERFRTVADFTYNWEYWQNYDGNYIYVSPSCKRISGHTSTEFMQNSGLMLHIIYPDDLKVYQYLTEKSNMIKNDTNEIDYRIICADRTIKWVSQVAHLIYDESDCFIGIRGSISDVTEKTLVKQLLKASEMKYRLISENVTEGLFICSNGSFQYTNNAMCHIFGYDENEFEGMKINHLIMPESREELGFFINQNNDSDKMLKLEIECLKKDHTMIFAAIHLNYYFYQKLVYGVVHDITDKKQIQKNIFQAIVRTEENERAFFSKELHDGLGPLLSTIKLYLQWSERPNSKKTQKEAILKAGEILEEALTTVKEISNKLSPHLLTYYGINSAIQCFIDKQLETSSLKINFQSNNRRRFDKEIEVAIYRTIIECINNTIKHARAKNITIKIIDSDKQLQIKYKDDGIGFDFAEIMSLKKGLGLYNIQTRIQSIDGKVKLQSKPGDGVKYLFVMNINNGKAQY